MKRCIFSGFFIFIMLFQSMDRYGMIAYYELNKAYITEMFCINKSRPELNCDGKCFLMQKLQEKNQTDEKIPLSSHVLKEISLFPILKMWTNGLESTESRSNPTHYESMIIRLVESKLLRPPQLS